jgi:hypothetical protein
MAVESSDSNSHCTFAVFNGFMHADYETPVFGTVVDFTLYRNPFMRYTYPISATDWRMLKPK